MRRRHGLGLATGLAALLLGFGAAPAPAAPALGIQLDRTTTPLTHGDERTVYEVTVENTGPQHPAVGQVLTCLGTPADGKAWFNATAFAYQWVRNGQAIPGATERTYATVAADGGKAIQCVVTGTNPNSVRQITEGIVTTTAGSNVVTAVTRIGSGTLTAGSKNVTGVTPSNAGLGGPFIVGQAITGDGIPAGTTIAAVGSGTLELSANATASGVPDLLAGAAPVAPGQLIFGNQHIPAGTEVTAVNGQQLTLAANATGSSAGESFYSTSNPPALVSTSASIASQPPAVVDPQPFPPPPSAKSPLTSGAIPASQPGVGLTERTCTPPDWDGAPTYTFQWLRNGVPIAGATSQKYEPGPDDAGTRLQCQVLGTNAGGAAIGISSSGRVLAADTPAAADAPVISFLNNTTGAVIVEIELPGGAETYVLRIVGSGWDCVKQPPAPAQHASATCTRSDTLSPGTAYPPIEVVERPGRDAPDTLVTKVSVSGGGAADPASAEDQFDVGPALPFGFAAFETKVNDQLGNDYTQAGGHPFSVGARVAFAEHVRAEQTSAAGFRAANGFAKVVKTDTPRGFVGNAQAPPQNCPTIADVVKHPSTCPAGSVVGGISLETSQGPFFNLPIYSMEPEFGTPAEFGFGIAAAGGEAYALTPELRADDGYAISLVTAPIQKNPELLEATVTLCGFGAKAGINSGNGESEFQGCKKATEAGANKKPLITNPTRCAGAAPTTRISAESWEEPGVVREARSTTPALTGCASVAFEPEIDLQPTSHQADSPTGLDVELMMPTQGLESPHGIAQANLEGATVTLPAGMSVNPSLASGLGACAPAQVGLGNNDEATCPQSSRVGTVEVTTPLLKDPLQGSVYVAQQGANPFRSLLALYLVFESEQAGITIKVAGRVTPNPSTGQLTTSFDENPEAPFSRIALHLAGGERAPLINPALCGSYGIESRLSPWSAVDPANPTVDETVVSTSVFQINSGPNGGPCPSGALNPKLKAGVAKPVAGSTSPFVFDLSREDGTQRFSGLDVTLPPGLTGYLKGVPYCADATLSAIPTAEGTGAAQLGTPSCPAASQLGNVTVGAGAGPTPFYTNTGRAYLAGPYKGAPLSLAIVTPALAGPFDLGNVVVRSAFHIDRETAQVTVKSDPIPTILHGLLLDVRRIRVNVDRPNFILAPTNCAEMAVGALVTGEKGGSAKVSDRFQVGSCAKLGFKPRFSARLFGGTKRGQNPRLRAVVTYGKGQANIKRAVVTLPHSEFLDQSHIQTICTRVQFAAKRCPVGSVYGHAKAFSPLVGYPVKGPVYLRSSNNPLPDLVMALRGPKSQPIEVDAVGRIDSVNGGIRTSLETVPDVPISKFILEMKGGRKSLLVNSRNICATPARVTVKFNGQNGKVHNARPLLKNQCGKKRKKGAQGD